MKTEFTKEELFEIEKVFDIVVIENQKLFAKILTAFDNIKSGNELNKKIFRDAYKVYDLYRTISTKAQSMRNKE